MKKIKLTKKNKIAIISITASVLVVLCVAFSFLFKIEASEQFVLTAEKATFENDASKYKDVIHDGAGNVLCFNPENAFVAIKRAGKSTFVTPCGEAAARDKNSSVLNVSVRDKKGNSYIMNSTDNSVLFKAFEVNEEKNALTVSFSFYKNAEDAKKGFKKSGFCVKIPLVFTTENGSFKAFVDCGNIETTKGIYVEKISILPGLFSVDGALSGEHFIIPDGSGALVDLSAEIPEDIIFQADVYGTDVAVKEYKEGAYLPCYAFSGEKEMISAIISEGEALATINCTRFKKAGSGKLFSEFTLTAVSSTEDGKALKIGEQYTGEIALTFNFSKVQKNSYNTLAVIVRDYFIKKGYLSDSLKNDFGDLPFFVSVIGSKNNSGTPYTTFEDASEIVSLLHSKGVRNVSLRVVGALTGGLKSEAVSKNPFLESLGGKDGVADLCKIATEKKSSVWVDANMYTGGNAIANLEGVVKVPLYSKVYEYMGEPNIGTNVSDSAVLGENISSVYSLVKGVKNLNVTLNDASFLLFTDATNKLTRQDLLEKTKESVNALSVNSSLMLTRPALWLMKNADAVSDVPLNPTLDGVYGVTGIPLLQMVIHGSVIYGSEPLNVNGGGWASVLKFIEYGAVPSFLFTYEDCNNLSYGSYASQTAQYYSKVKSLKTIQGMTITSHEKLLSGVYKVTYGYSKVVYVNYNKSVVTIDGLLLSPQDFILV